MQVKRKPCRACHAALHPVDRLVCSGCWAGLPLELKRSFNMAGTQVARREAARRIFEWLLERNQSEASNGA